MAITTVQGGTSKLKSVEISISKPASGVIGPGGVVLTHGQQVRVPVADAHTLVSGNQATFLDESKPESKK